MTLWAVVWFALSLWFHAAQLAHPPRPTRRNPVEDSKEQAQNPPPKVALWMATYRESPGSHALLPDPDVTPGAIRTTDAKEICAKTFRTGPYRKTTAAQKKMVYEAYSQKPGSGICAWRKYQSKSGRPMQEGCEVDHLVPLELGGDDVVANLWPQPYHWTQGQAKPFVGAHDKDKLENELHRMVCAGRIDLKAAQLMLTRDWYASYRQLGLGK